MQQLDLLKTHLENPYDEKSYICSDGTLEKLLSMDHNCIFLYGSPGAGKTHLSSIWIKKHNASLLNPPYSINDNKSTFYVIENFDRIKTEYETEILHCYNNIKDLGGSLLMTASVLPKNINISLPDLRSRIVAAPLIKIPEPDDELLKIILAKAFTMHNIRVNNKIIDYILKRSERSVYSMLSAVLKIELYAQKHDITKITIHTVSTALKT